MDDDVVLPVVGECDDSSIDDTRGRHLTEADVIAALDGAKGGAVAEAAEEAVLNALLRATPVTGRDGDTVEPIPIDALTRVLEKYGRL